MRNQGFLDQGGREGKVEKKEEEVEEEEKEEGGAGGEKERRNNNATYPSFAGHYIRTQYPELWHLLSKKGPMVANKTGRKNIEKERAYVFNDIIDPAWNQPRAKYVHTLCDIR